MAVIPEVKGSAAVASSLIAQWDTDLTDTLSVPTGLWQNAGKKEIMFRTCGRGAREEMDKFYGKQDGWYEGTPKHTVKHLG
eukprot:8077939-Pyramimonas_sp.AAC.1